MRLSLLISLSLALLAVPAARSQTADEFFDGGAQFYISNNIPAALKKTVSGLKLYPDNVKLKKLEELLKQQQKQQSQQNQQRKNNESRSSQSQNSQQQKQNRNPSKQAQRNQQSEKQKQQPAQSSASRQNQSQKQAAQPARTGASGRMTPEEAKRLLDAQKGNEQFLQFKPKPPPPGSPQPIEDW